MEYTVQKLAELAGVSSRTLRYYDQLGLLKPSRMNSSGYRVYGLNEVNRLQQILFYRALGVNLDRIREILEKPGFNELTALKEHRRNLLEKQEQINALLSNVEKTIAAIEGRIEMMDNEKFEGFKQKMIDDNEATYGREIRSKYGDAVVDKSNQRFGGMSETDYLRFESLGNEVLAALRGGLATGDPGSAPAQKAADLHRQWLSFAWDSYTKEAHAGLAEMYASDPRFTAFYDKEQPGTAQFLRDAILIYTGMNRN